MWVIPGDIVSALPVVVHKTTQRISSHDNVGKCVMNANKYYLEGS